MWHTNIVAAQNTPVVLRLVIPVCDHDAGVTPFFPEDAGKQVIFFGGVVAVEQVVGGHNTPGAAFLHHDLKTLQVDLTQSPLADPGVAAGTVGFLIVNAEMLGTSADTLGLDTLNHGSGQLTRHQGIFGVVLKVTAAQRTTVDIHSRGQPHTDIILPDFLAGGFAYLVHDLGIPSGCQHGSHRPGGGVYAPVRADPQAGRAIGSHDCRHLGSFQAADATGIRHTTIGTATAKGDQLVIGQAFDELFHGDLTVNYGGELQFIGRRVDAMLVGDHIFRTPTGVDGPIHRVDPLRVFAHFQLFIGTVGLHALG